MTETRPGKPRPLTLSGRLSRRHLALQVLKRCGRDPRPWLDSWLQRELFHFSCGLSQQDGKPYLHLRLHLRAAKPPPADPTEITIPSGS